MRITLVSILSVGMASQLVAQSETVSTMSRNSLLQQQLSVLDGRASEQYGNSVRLQPPTIVVPGSPSQVPVFTGTYSGPFLSLARTAANRNNVPADLFLRLIQQESAWNQNAVSHAGAIGLAQLMPGTARDLGVNPRDPAQNLDGGARYLRQQYETFGSWRLALAAYNAGPGAVRRFDGVPPYAETQNYVRVIWGE